MKALCSLPALFFVLLHSVFSQDTIRIYYDKDWKEIKNISEAEFYRKAYWDSSHVWAVKDYFMSHKIQMTGTYKSKDMKVRHGHFVYYHENGNTSSDGNYMNDKAVDLWTIWHENGQMKSKGKYADDKLEGVWEYWFDTGEKKSAGTYLKGEREGLWKFWYKTGEKECEETYRKGQIVSATGFFENGIMKYRGSYVNGVRQGEWTYWNVDGRMFLKGKFNFGQRTGEWVRMFLEGEMRINYKFGNIEGPIPGGIFMKSL
jgi:antitoxin component YwqK of YwqJK toxin-antitoxin module